MATPYPLEDAPRIDEMPMEDPSFTQNVDGAQVSRMGEGAVVDFNPAMSAGQPVDPNDHAANLVDAISNQEQTELANKIIEYVDIDIQSRQDWQRRMDQGMELMGLTDIPGSELPFNGASAVTYPLISKAVVQFQARALEEIFPSDGPVKVTVIGKKSLEKEEQAERVREHMNYQMLHEDRSYFWNTDQMLFYLPLGGSAFKKSYFDEAAKLLVGRFIKSNDFIVPYTAVDLITATRYTHKMIKSDGEMKKLFANNFYKEVDLLKTPFGSDGIDEAQEHIDKADSRTQTTHFDDTQNTLLECHIDLELSIDREKYPLPYIATVLKENQTLIGLRRNWKADDPGRVKRMWFTHYRYLPGLGFYGFGLLHMIGSLAEATSAAIRALLDAAMFANMQGGYASSDLKFKPGEERITPGVYKQVNMTAEELNKSFFTPPFREPSAALAQLADKLIEAGEGFASSTEVMTGEASNTGPVGTTIALIEQGSKPFSGIHRRLHMAAAEEFHLRGELNFEHMADNYPYEIEGKDQYVLRRDYDGRVDIMPVSDPNIFSSTQRIAQGQALVQLSAENPDLYDRKQVHLRMLKAMKIPEPETLFGGEQAKRWDPVTENAFMLVGKPVKSFLDQDHDGHLTTHLNFLSGLNEDALKNMGAPLQAHLAEHYAMKYWSEMNRMAGGQLPPLNLNGGGPEEPELPPEADAQIAQFAAQQPPIDLMPQDVEPDFSQAEFEAEQRRLDEGHVAELLRTQEAHELALQAKAEETAAKVDQGDKQTEAKVEQGKKVTKAKVEETRKLGEEKVKVAKEQANQKIKVDREASKLKIEEVKAVSKVRTAEKIKTIKAKPKGKPSGKR